jgi:transcription elongation factor Elf1
MSSRDITFQEKCPKCGELASFKTRLYANNGSGSAKCSKCKKTIKYSYEGDKITKVS